MAAFPSTLPRPLANSYSITPVDPAIRTDMEMGAARSRRRTAARNDKTAIAWRFTDAQLATFRAWFDDSSTGAAGGASWFTYTLPIGTGGTASIEARIIDGYTVEHLGGYNWQVSAKMEVR